MSLFSPGYSASELSLQLSLMTYLDDRFRHHIYPHCVQFNTTWSLCGEGKGVTFTHIVMYIGIFEIVSSNWSQNHFAIIVAMRPRIGSCSSSYFTKQKGSYVISYVL